MIANIEFEIEGKTINCLIGAGGEIDQVTVDGRPVITGENADPNDPDACFIEEHDQEIAETVIDRLREER